MTIDENIIKVVEKAVITILTKHLTAIDKKIESLKVETPQEPDLAAIELKDAANRLKISIPKLKQLINTGEIKAFTPPGGRLKIVNVSLNDYIRKEAGM